MLIFPIHREWYDKILSGEKSEEYRSKSRYWRKRLENAFGLPLERAAELGKTIEVQFRNGYGADRPTISATVGIRIGEGRREWGAVPEVDYFVLCIKNFVEVTKHEVKDLP